MLLAPGLVERMRPNEPLTMSFPGTEGSLDNEESALSLARRWRRDEIAIAIPNSDEKITLKRSALGVEIDEERLLSRLAHLEAKESASRRRSRELRQTEVALAPPVELDFETALSALYRIKDKVDRFPVDARIDIDNRKIIAEEEGRWLDIWGTLSKLEDAWISGASEVEAVVSTKAPRVTAAQIADIDYGEVLGWFETRYSRNLKYEARTFNLRLAASKFDGHVLFPGDEFDFNEVVGPRDEANGYQVATVIAQGELVDGIGGGTCQVAGTLHGAAVFSGLEITERRPHTRPSSYIKMGLDAAVVFPTITLKLRNPFPYPVVLRETVEGGIVRAEVLGPKGARKTVSYIRKVDGFTPFREIERQDPRLPKGVQVLAQRGVPGFRLRRYRLVQDGAFSERERWNDYYPPTAQIIRVGTGDMPKDSVRIPNERHPEYVADAYLMMTQGPDIEKGMVEVNEQGTTGRYGWTQRVGLPYWVPGKGSQVREGEGEACIEAACARPPKGPAKGNANAKKKRSSRR